jgi:hypothetical protein
MGKGTGSKLKGFATARLSDGTIRFVELRTGMKRTGSAKKKLSSSGSSRSAVPHSKGPRFLVCVKNTDYEASLEVRKIYQTLPDALAAELFVAFYFRFLRRP